MEDIWIHVDSSGVITNTKKVTCRNCSLSIAYSGNTTNLKSHNNAQKALLNLKHLQYHHFLQVLSTNCHTIVNATKS
jgi:hypothetical protein